MNNHLNVLLILRISIFILFLGTRTNVLASPETEEDNNKETNTTDGETNRVVEAKQANLNNTLFKNNIFLSSNVRSNSSPFAIPRTQDFKYIKNMNELTRVCEFMNFLVMNHELRPDSLKPLPEEFELMSHGVTLSGLLPELNHEAQMTASADSLAPNPADLRRQYFVNVIRIFPNQLLVKRLGTLYKFFVHALQRVDAEAIRGIIRHYLVSITGKSDVDDLLELYEEMHFALDMAAVLSDVYQWQAKAQKNKTLREWFKRRRIAAIEQIKEQKAKALAEKKRKANLAKAVLNLPPIRAGIVQPDNPFSDEVIIHEQPRRKLSVILEGQAPGEFNESDVQHVQDKLSADVKDIDIDHVNSRNEYDRDPLERKIAHLLHKYSSSGENKSINEVYNQYRAFLNQGKITKNQPQLSVTHENYLAQLLKLRKEILEAQTANDKLTQYDYHAICAPHILDFSIRINYMKIYPKNI